MNHVQYLRAFGYLWQTAQDQDGIELSHLSAVLSEYQRRNRLPQQCAFDQLLSFHAQYKEVRIKQVGKYRTNLLAYILDNPDSLYQSDIETILSTPIGGKIYVGDITLIRL